MREIQVFRETIRLEVALLQAGAAFEHTCGVQRRVGEDARQQPAEDIVFFDNVRFKAELPGEINDLLSRDHSASPLPSSKEPTTATN